MRSIAPAKKTKTAYYYPTWHTTRLRCKQVTNTHFVAKITSKWNKTSKKLWECMELLDNDKGFPFVNKRYRQLHSTIVRLRRLTCTRRIVCFGKTFSVQAWDTLPTSTSTCSHIDFDKIGLWSACVWSEVGRNLIQTCSMRHKISFSSLSEFNKAELSTNGGLMWNKGSTDLRSHSVKASFTSPPWARSQGSSFVL